jgi:predicted choloylglycine hydrolase
MWNCIKTFLYSHSLYTPDEYCNKQYVIDKGCSIFLQSYIYQYDKRIENNNKF